MASHTDRNNKRNTRTKRELNNFSANTYASATFRNTETIALDDLIASLANAPENRRARQVGEWESMSRQMLQVSA